MAEKRKGCGLLIAALVATIIAAIVGFMGIKSGVDDIQSGVAENSAGAVSFATPSSGTFKAPQDKDGTVWLTSTDGNAPSKPTGYSVTVVDESGKEITVTNSVATVTIMNQVKLASFPCTKDSIYNVSVAGLPDSSSIEVSHSSAAEALGGAGKVAGGLFGALGLGFVAFVLGLIGIIRWFTSKPKVTAPPVA